MNIVEVAEIIANEGGRLYLVGGAVRDKILGIEPHDRDYCVQGLSVDKFTRLFPNAKVVGKEFSVFRMNNSEFAFARSELKVSKGYKGFEIHTSEDITIEEDLKRRDITINSIAEDVLTGKIVDPYGGVKDIKNHIIKHTSNAFSEDPLRAYRAARFAAKYNFNISNDTIILMKKQRDDLKNITLERVFEELRKALCTNTPSIFFNILKKAELLDVHFNELNNVDKGLFEQIAKEVDKLAKLTLDESVVFAGLTYKLEKDNILNLCNSLKLPTKWKKKALDTQRYYTEVQNCIKRNPYDQAVLYNKINRSAIGLDDLELIINVSKNEEFDIIEKNTINIKSFSYIAKKAINSFTGKELIDKGITIESVGKKEFLHELYKGQSEVIKKLC